MSLHVAEIAATIGTGAHAVSRLDQTAWHSARALAFPDNITLLSLPSRDPELNLQENIWQFLHTWLSNRLFQFSDDMVDHSCTARNRLVDRP